MGRSVIRSLISIIIYLCMLWPLNLLGATVGLVVDAQNEQIQVFQGQLARIRPDDKIDIVPASSLSGFDQTKVDKWVTLGGKSLNDLLSVLKKPSSPILALFLPDSQRLKLRAKHQPIFTTLDNSPDHAKQLSLIRALAPQAKQVGAYYSSQYVIDQESLNKTAKQFGLTLHWAELKNPLDWDRNALKVLSDVDLVLGVNDDALYNSTTIRSILMRLYRSGKALIGPDKGYVRAGAVASVYAGIEETLKATADWIGSNAPQKEILQNPYFNVSVNSQVARSLNIVIENEGDLVKQIKEGSYE